MQFLPNYLKLNISKAKKKLHWSPIWTLDEALDLIVEWQVQYLKGEDMQSASLRQIKLYQKDILK